MQFTLIYILIFFSLVFLLWECKPLIRQGNWKDLLVALFILFIALSYGLDYALDLKMLPNPDLLLHLVKPASKVFDNFYQVTG